jgi:hypothetical protein
MNLYSIYSVIKYKYAGVTDERMLWLWIVRDDWNIFCHFWINWRLFRFIFKTRNWGCLPCLTPLLLQNMALGLQHCIDSSSDRKASSPVRINVA